MTHLFRWFSPRVLALTLLVMGTGATVVTFSACRADRAQEFAAATSPAATEDRSQQRDATNAAAAEAIAKSLAVFHQEVARAETTQELETKSAEVVRAIADAGSLAGNQWAKYAEETISGVSRASRNVAETAVRASEQAQAKERERVVQAALKAGTSDVAAHMAAGSEQLAGFATEAARTTVDQVLKAYTVSVNRARWMELTASLRTALLSLQVFGTVPMVQEQTKDEPKKEEAKKDEPKTDPKPKIPDTESWKKEINEFWTKSSVNVTAAKAGLKEKSVEFSTDGIEYNPTSYTLTWKFPAKDGVSADYLTTLLLPVIKDLLDGVKDNANKEKIANNFKVIIAGPPPPIDPVVVVPCPCPPVTCGPCAPVTHCCVAPACGTARFHGLCKSSSCGLFSRKCR